MEALVSWLKAIFGSRWVIVLPIVVSLVYAYNRYENEIHYHAWAAGYTIHHFDPTSVEYEENHVRVRWITFPKVADDGFEEQYILHSIGREPLGIYEFEHPTPNAKPYRDGYITDETNIKHCNCWGSWIEVGKLEPGQYELEIRYDYDSWLYPDWSADQRIKFTVE